MPKGDFAKTPGFRFCFKRGGRFIGFEIVGGLGITIVVPGQCRIDQAGNDGINSDAKLTELKRCRFHQADNAPFGRRIGSAIFGAVPTLRR